MERLNRTAKQKGFAAVETVLIVVIVGLIAFVVWYAFTSKSDTESTLGNAANSSSTPPKTTAKNTTSTTKTSGVVIIKTDSKGNKYLADSNGKTLYIYGADAANISNCSGSCLDAWPIFKASTANGITQANVGTITRSDGTIQYTYKQLPLYYYTGDGSVGQVTGNNVNNFKLATP